MLFQRGLVERPLSEQAPIQMAATKMGGNTL
jgi:hypothetical protein